MGTMHCGGFERRREDLQSQETGGLSYNRTVRMDGELFPREPRHQATGRPSRVPLDNLGVPRDSSPEV